MGFQDYVATDDGLLRERARTSILAPPVGLEPTTDGLTARRSTTLSYGGTRDIGGF